MEDSQSVLKQVKYNNQNLTFYSHLERAGSYRALLVSALKEKFTIVLLSNNYTGNIHEIAEALISIIKN